MALNLTTREFGAALGISSGAVSSIETGYRNVTDKHIKLICAAFPTVSEQWIRTGEGNMFVKSSSDLIDDVCKQYDLDSIAKAMLRAYVELDASSRAVISGYIRSAVLEYNADAQTQAIESSMPIQPAQTSDDYPSDDQPYDDDEILVRAAHRATRSIDQLNDPDSL